MNSYRYTDYMINLTIEEAANNGTCFDLEQNSGTEASLLALRVADLIQAKAATKQVRVFVTDDMRGVRVEPIA